MAISSPRIRVLHIVSRMSIGGVQTCILEILKRANYARFESAVLCTKKEGALAGQVRAMGVELTAQKTLPPWDPYQIWRLSRVIRRLRPDLAHVHMAPTVVCGAQAARLAGVRRVVIHHHSDYTSHWAGLHPLVRRWEWSLTRKADAVISVSGTVAAATDAQITLDPVRHEAIPNGIDLAVFRPGRRGEDPRATWKLPPETPVVIQISRFLESKRIEDFIEAAAIVTRRWAGSGPAPAFVVVGNGPRPLEAGYRRQIEALGGAVNVWLEGGRYDIPDLLPWADAAVLATEREGCPLTILEYMAAGVPMAVTNIPAILELARADRDGLMSPVRQPEALAGNIERLLRDRELAARLRESGLERVKAFGWESAVRRYEAIYERLMGAGGKLGG